MKAIVGYTGFVGSNIYAAGTFEAAYNTKNISDSFGSAPDLLVYSGIRAEKYIANNEPEKDLENIIEAENNITKIAPDKLVLISTVDVYSSPVGVNEDSAIDMTDLQPYGRNRYALEQWVRTNYPNALIVRLPGLFGKNIKKNFIYDLINVVPYKLRDDRFLELSANEPLLKESYTFLGNGFYQLKPEANTAELKTRFESLGFTALNFTDSRSRFQFYDLSRLWSDIEIALKSDIKLLNLATEPVSANDIYCSIKGSCFINEISATPANYDFRTKFGALYGSNNEYILDKDTVLRSITEFVNGYIDRSI